MERKTGPRFHNKVAIPEVPEQMVLVKFHGKPVLLPEQDEGESLIGNTSLTRRQILILGEYDIERRRDAR